MKPRKHQALIKLWADGAEIEYYSVARLAWVKTDTPQWDNDIKYRVKPVPKIEKWLWANELGEVCNRYNAEQIGEYTEKLEWSMHEFPVNQQQGL